MRYLIAILAFVAAAISGVAADLCSKGSKEEKGNFYCQAVSKIAYTGFGKSGSYKKVTNMYPSCETSPYDYTGPLAPFNEEVSLHFRGPMVVNQVAVYTPSGSSSKAKARRTTHERRHGHAGFHKHNKEIREIQEAAQAEERGVGDVVTATMGGKVVHWINSYNGAPATSAPAPTSAAPVPAAKAADNGAGVIGDIASSFLGGDHSSSSADSSPTESSTPVTGGDWSRVAYFNKDSQTAQGLVFLNNMGGAASGVFDNTYGNSLSYASPDSLSAAGSPQVSNGTLASNKEFVIFSDKKCKGDSCGYYRDGSVAHHGFDGEEKAFLFEFSMPDDGSSGWNMNMPSGWILNAAIPRTGQYSSCSCWDTGCGEFDWCEVLDSGNKKCKSTWHGNTPGGSSDYFDRPTNGPIKMAVVMANNNINVQVLDDSTTFGSSMSKATINKLCKNSGNTDAGDFLTSLFALVS